VKAIEEAFAALVERQPTDKERQRLMRERDALRLKDNDALWHLLVVLGHYETLYAGIPARIAKVASDVTDNVKTAAAAELKAAAAGTRAELAKSVAQTALDIAARVASTKRWQWFSMSFAFAVTLLVGVAVWMYRQGVSSGAASGRLDGYTTARDEIAANSWANTPEGQLGYELAKVGSLRDLATCSGKIVVRKGEACFVKVGKESVFGWHVPAATKSGR
jgi:hypothetical protein